MKYLIVLFLAVVMVFSACQERVLYPLSDDYVEGEDDTDSGSSKSTKKRRRRRRRSSSGGSSSNPTPAPVTDPEQDAIDALESATGTTLTLYSGGDCPANNWDDGDPLDPHAVGSNKLNADFNTIRFNNRVFDKTTTPEKGSDSPDQDIIHKLDVSNENQAVIWIKASHMTFFAGSAYRWYLYSKNAGEAPKIELNPSSVSVNDRFYRFTESYTRALFLSGDSFFDPSVATLSSGGDDLVFAIGKAGKCWSVRKNP